MASPQFEVKQRCARMEPLKLKQSTCGMERGRPAARRFIASNPAPRWSLNDSPTQRGKSGRKQGQRAGANRQQPGARGIVWNRSGGDVISEEKIGTTRSEV